MVYRFNALRFSLEKSITGEWGNLRLHKVVVKQSLEYTERKEPQKLQESNAYGRKVLGLKIRALYSS